MSEQANPFYGKYRGIVKDINDPEKRGRLRAVVQDVLGKEYTGWALPCTPYAGKGVGLFLIPPVNSLVWIEFENGDPDYPIWTGCFWAKTGEVPAEQGNPDIKILKTQFCTIKLDDSSDNEGKNKGITIETKIGNEERKIVMDHKEIKITSSGKIEINAGIKGKIVLESGKVSINDGALEVE